MMAIPIAHLLAASGPAIALWSLLGLLLIALLAAFVWFMPYALMWVKGRVSGAQITLRDILDLRSTEANPGHIVDCAVVLAQVGEVVSAGRLADHEKEGGHLNDVVRGLCLARTADVGLTFERACEIDLAGHSVLGAVTSVVNARDIYLRDPESGGERIHALCGDGVELELWARMTVRTDLDHLVEGATPEELSERMAEAMAEQVQQTADHESILADPDQLAERVRRLHLDRDAALTVESVDVVDVNRAGEGYSAEDV
jgi:uncharacterized protein YqfA (UPF0365 family)